MAAWVAVEEQIVWLSALATTFTVVCDACRELGESAPSVQGTLALDALRGTFECAGGHRLRVEREGR